MLTNRSTRSSFAAAITLSIIAMSPAASASMARMICSSTSPPICSTRERTLSSSASNCLEVCSAMAGEPIALI